MGLASFSQLSRRGVLGKNRRNLDFIFPYNAYKDRKVVDNKEQTKILLAQHDLPHPPLYGVVHSRRDIDVLRQVMDEQDSFVVKPGKGRRGKGIAVLTRREGVDDGIFLRSCGEVVTAEWLQQHVYDIVSGVYALDGRRDTVLLEYRIVPPTLFTEIGGKGVPDIRIIILEGKPLMAMLRLPTGGSEGKANLHMGGVGVGVDLVSGRTTYSIWNGQNIERHPDTDKVLAGIQLPHWNEMLDIAIRFQQVSKLGFVGVDMVLDETMGPLILEGNARPGLAIQQANQKGLLKALEESRTVAQKAKRVG